MWVKGSKGAGLSSRTLPDMCEVHGDRFKEFPTDSGGDSASSPECPRCAKPGGVAFNLSKSIYHFSYWLISRAPLTRT